VAGGYKTRNKMKKKDFSKKNDVYENEKWLKNFKGTSATEHE